jgi:hypothetical protein
MVRPVGSSFLGCVIAVWTAALDGIVSVAGVVPPGIRIRVVIETTPACTISVMDGFYDEPIVEGASCGLFAVFAVIACVDCAIFCYFVCQVRHIKLGHK